jgi:hypothetical protein
MPHLVCKYAKLTAFQVATTSTTKGDPSQVLGPWWEALIHHWLLGSSSECTPAS